MEKHEFICRIEVRSYEMDSFGHVNHAVYLNYLEAARGDFLRAHGLDFSHFDAWKSWPVIASASINYHRPAHFGETLEIKVVLEKMGKSSLLFSYLLSNAASEKVVTAETTLVFVNERGKPMAIPEGYRELFGTGSADRSSAV